MPDDCRLRGGLGARAGGGNLPALRLGRAAGMAEANMALLLQKLERMQAQLDALEERSAEDQPKRRSSSEVEWQDVVVEFVYLPLLIGLAMLGLWPLLGAALRAVESGACGALSAYGSMQFRRFHLGLHERLPKLPTGQLLLTGLEGAASLATLIVFVVESGRHEVVSSGVKQCLAIFFIVRRLVDGLREEFHLRNLLNVTVLIDAFTIPGLVFQGTWLSLGFLRGLSAVLAYERWKRLANVNVSLQDIASRSVSRTITFMALRMMALILAFAGITFVLEILGEVPFLEASNTVDTGMGQLTLFSTVYWVVETLTTVGYGDFTPTTVPSRVMCVFCMIAGILFFTIEMSRLQEVIGSQKFGIGHYKKQSFVGAHVVLFGGCVNCMDQDLLGGFLDELFSKNSHPWPDLVIMGPDTEKMMQLRDSIEYHFQTRPVSNSPLDRIIELVGSPLRVEDLERCGCATAHTIYIIPNTSGEEAAAVEDKSNILIALSVKDVCPQTSFRLMLLDGNSRVQALDAGIRSQRCFAVDEIRGAMLWESCRCPGWSTMLTNLITNVALEQFPTSEKNWWSLYARGLDLEIYGFLVDPRFYGVSVTEFALTAFQQNGACVVAALLKSGAVSLIPSREKVHRDMVVFAISDSKEGLRGLADRESSRDWMRVLRDAQELHRFDDARAPYPTTQDWLGGEAPEEEGRAAQELGRQRVAQELRARVQRIRATARAGASAGATPFLLVVNLSPTWQRRGWRHFGTFLKKLRQAAPAGRLSVVMLCRTMPNNEAIDALGLAGDEGIGICVGEPTAALDLARSGARECAAIVCSTTSVLAEGGHREAQEMRDADAVLVYRVLEGMGQSHKHMVLEFRHPENLRLLPKKGGTNCNSSCPVLDFDASTSFQQFQSSVGFNYQSSMDVDYFAEFSATSKEEELDDSRQDRRRSSCQEDALLEKQEDCKPQFGDLEYAFNAHFASGGIFTPRILGTLMGGAYCNRALLEVVQAFLLLSADGSDPPESSLHQVSAAAWADRAYSDVFERLTRDPLAPAVPVGLRRLWSSEVDVCPSRDNAVGFGGSAAGRYVACNPKGHEVVWGSDVLLVLASPEFVERAQMDGSLLGLGD